jgi:hypothetical protein
MTAITSVTLDVPDPAAAEAFYDAFGVADHVAVRASKTPSTGFLASRCRWLCPSRATSTPSSMPPSPTAPQR